MSTEERFMRAFRPSRFTPHEANEEDLEQAKQSNVTRYAARVEAGLPLFEPPSVPGQFKGQSVQRIAAAGN